MQIGAGIRVGSGITIQLPASITISSHPSSTTINYGTTATFSVTATATLGATLSYQWQSQPSGGSWSNIAGATSSSYTTSSQTNTNSGDSYRVIVSGTRLAAPRTSNTATLTVTSASITIDSHPGDSTVNSGDTATFTVSASATLSATLSYQWQKQESGAGEWSNISGATSSSYTTGSLTVADDNTDKYRVVVSATKNATSVTSNSATLTVNASNLPNTFTVANYDDTNNTGINYWGASNGYIFIAQSATYGTLTSDYITAVTVAYNGDIYQTWIRMNFFGTASGFTIGGDGSIDNDLQSYRRTFTIGNSSYYFTYNGSYYVRYSDIASLTSSVGSTLAISYDPNSQPSYSNNTLWVESYIDQYTSLYGCNRNDQNNPVFGQIRSSSIQFIYYNQGGNQTRIKMITGNFGSFTVSVAGSISGDGNGSTRKFTVNGSTYTFTYTSAGEYYTASGDVLSLVSNVGAEWSIAYDPNAQTSGGGGGGGGGSGTTYTAGTDYSDGSGGPSGVAFAPVGGPYAYPQFVLFESAWTNSAGFNAMKALTSGTTFTVSAYPASGGSPVTSTITLLSNFSNPYGGQWVADMSSSPTVSTGMWPNNVPLSVTTGGGGGGGTGTEVTLQFGFWDGNGPGTALFLFVMASNTAGIAAMDSLAPNATITLTDSVTTPSTVQVTMFGGFTKSGPGGPPGNESYTYAGTTSSPNSNPSNYQSLTTVTLPSSGGGGGGGGGGGNTTVTLFNGMWYDDGFITFRVLATDTTNIGLMDAIPSGATLTITDNSSNTTTITVNGTLSKAGPFGPPGSERYFWDGTATTNNADFPTKYGFITTIVY